MHIDVSTIFLILKQQNSEHSGQLTNTVEQSSSIDLSGFCFEQNTNVKSRSRTICSFVFLFLIPGLVITG